MTPFLYFEELHFSELAAGCLAHVSCDYHPLALSLAPFCNFAIFQLHSLTLYSRAHILPSLTLPPSFSPPSPLLPRLTHYPPYPQHLPASSKLPTLATNLGIFLPDTAYPLPAHSTSVTLHPTTLSPAKIRPTLSLPPHSTSLFHSASQLHRLSHFHTFISHIPPPLPSGTLSSSRFLLQTPHPPPLRLYFCTPPVLPPCWSPSRPVLPSNGCSGSTWL